MNGIDIADLAAPDSLLARLRGSCAEDWEAYVWHPFVRGIGDGALPEAQFRHYLIQDYLFLIHFSRAYALAVYKADRLQEMREAASVLHLLLHTEMKLHVEFCAQWGLTEAEMETAPEAKPCMAYTRFVLERGLAGDLLDLLVALAPCVFGYAEVGRRLAAHPDTVLDGNPYRAWIEMYSSDEFCDGARAAVAQMDRVAGLRLGWSPGQNDMPRFDDLARTFRAATRLEADFWQMGVALIA